METERGLGLHFTAYEHIDGYWIPELFQLRNWTDESYSQVRTSGFEVRRESFGSVERWPQRVLKPNRGAKRTSRGGDRQLSRCGSAIARSDRDRKARIPS
jgi:hypothetical protein